MSTVTTYGHGFPYSILQPGYYPPREGEGFHVYVTDADLVSILDSASRSRIIALDLETRGTAIWDQETYIVGIGLAWDTGSCYIDVASISEGNWNYFLEWVSQVEGLIAHNVYFDGGFLWRELRGTHPHWHACTYGLYYQLANEGFEGQTWNLKDAQTALLQWTDTNERELDLWLIHSGYIGSISKEEKEGYYWVDGYGKDELGRWLSPDKGEMWRAPAEILGHYCILDAESTYLLYVHVLEPAYLQFPALVTYHTEDFLPLVEILIEQNYLGISVDRPALERHREYLLTRIEELRSAFVKLPDVFPHVSAYEGERITRWIGKEPPQWKVRKLGKEPGRWKKDGTESRVWQQWYEKSQRPREVRQDWLVWAAKRDRIESGDLPDECRFNLDSDLQMRWLLYDALKFPVFVRTESELPSCSGDALKQMGELGALLREREDLSKELTYVDSYLRLITPAGRIHPSWRVPGTLTGRLAGKVPNVQQIPKTTGTMSCFRADPGKVWIDCDVNALEQVVLAELSKDPALWKIYGPGAKPNDIYLFTGSQIPALSAAIRSAGYDPDNPTPEGIASAKKQAKRYRNISKVVVLSSSYGAGPGKIHRTLTLEGVDISFEEVKEIHRAYWELYAGVRKFDADLQREWRGNGGWVLNGVGRPVCVAEDCRKDIVNRVCQSTGHDLLMQYIQIVRKLLDIRGISWQPIIVDWHDEMIIQVDAVHAEEVREIMEVGAYAILNQVIGWEIHLKGSASIVRNLAECKIEE